MGRNVNFKFICCLGGTSWHQILQMNLYLSIMFGTISTHYNSLRFLNEDYGADGAQIEGYIQSNIS